MKILGLDWGEKKIGLALSFGTLSGPLEVIRYSDTTKLFNRLEKIIKDHSVEKIVVGISEGRSGDSAKNFAKNLGEELKIPIELFDETLTSRDARILAMEAGQKRKKARAMEDAYAASLMLQSYLDNH